MPNTDTETATMAPSIGRNTPDLPRLIVDTREQRPLYFEHLDSVRGTLATGDYSLEGLEGAFMIERKTWPDFIRSVTSERVRFFRELERGKEAPCRRLVIIGSLEELKDCLIHRRVTVNAILGNMASIDANLWPVVLVDTPLQAAKLIERLAVYFWAGAQRPRLGRVEIPAWVRDGVLNLKG